MASPPWLERLFLTVFFDNCARHAGSKQERKYFCKASSSALCFYCLGEHAHGEADIIQVRRYVYNDVLRIEDIAPYMDVSGIQPYVINGCKALMLRKKLRSRTAKPASHACQSCRRSLGEEYQWCCLSCKYYGPGSGGAELRVNIAAASTATAELLGSEDCSSIEEEAAAAAQHPSQPAALLLQQQQQQHPDKCDTPTSGASVVVIKPPPGAQSQSRNDDESPREHPRLRRRHNPLLASADLLLLGSSSASGSPRWAASSSEQSGSPAAIHSAKGGGGMSSSNSSSNKINKKKKKKKRALLLLPQAVAGAMEQAGGGCMRAPLAPLVLRAVSPQRLKHPRKAIPTRAPLF